jgi:hypothetical protein
MKNNGNMDDYLGIGVILIFFSLFVLLILGYLGNSTVIKEWMHEYHSCW